MVPIVSIEALEKSKQTNWSMHRKTRLLLKPSMRRERESKAQITGEMARGSRYQSNTERPTEYSKRGHLAQVPKKWSIERSYH